MGAQLNQVELRHAMASNIGAAIFSVVEAHQFFLNCKIANIRFKHQDYLDHVITIAYNTGLSDVKAKNIEKLYKDLADSTANIFNVYIQKTNKVLDLMDKIDSIQKGIFKNKWTFVDTFSLLYNYFEKLDFVNEKKFVEQLKIFEQKRLVNNKNPEALIGDPTLPYDKDLYDYVQAFMLSGNIQKNIETLLSIFKKNLLVMVYIQRIKND